MRTLAILALSALSIIVMAVYLPMLYEKLFFDRIGKTHLFYSPVTERFIFKETIVGEPPRAVIEKSEDHHAKMAYQDADGTYYSRVEFEKHLPFIYYKNMELWGLLPLRLAGQEFDKDTIKKNRQVLELKARDINGRKPVTALWPLLESNPGTVRLVFPEDRFRTTDTAMVFVNADNNRVDAALTERFTNALKKEGFIHPARSVNGKFTILKPFDEGVFMVDARYQVFHVKRWNGYPIVVKTPIDTALKTQHIQVSENKRREYYGLLLAGDGSLHLLRCDQYKLVRLPLYGYDPQQMDFKLILNPLYATAIYSDDDTIRAVAMNREYAPIANYTHRMSRAASGPGRRIHDMIFPFSLHLTETTGSRFLALSGHTGGGISLIGIAGCLTVYTAGCLLRRRRPHLPGLCLLAFTGIFGLITMVALGDEA